MSIYQPDGPLDHDAWKAERAKIAARDARRRERAAANPLPIIPELWRPYVSVFAVGLFGAAALLTVCAFMWGG